MTEKAPRVFTMKLLLVTLLLSYMFFDVPGTSGDVGTASAYDPPYLPTRCGGYNQEQFPPGGYFVAASDGVWDNGAACGRRYSIRCISGPRRPCKNGFIVVQVVDFCRQDPCPATLLLSTEAFGAISRNMGARINIEFAQI